MKTINTNKSSAPPSPENHPIEWLRKNFFSTSYNSLLSLILFSLIFWGITNFISWATTEAEWQVIKVNLPLLMVGRYPRDQYWRIWLIVGIISSFSGFSWGVIARNSATLFKLPVLIFIAVLPVIIFLIPVNVTFKLLLLGIVILVIVTAWIGKKLGRKKSNLGKYLSFSWLIAFLLIIWFIGGGLGLKAVSTNDWGGLMLTILMAVISIFLSFPLGVLLALGRQSTLSVIRIFSIGYIEIIRGLPLISALKVAIPSIVGQFISLFQDTTLLSIVGLIELLGISRSILAQPQFLGDYAEVYLLDGALFWIICYAMSVGSRQLEKKLNTTH